MAAAAASSLGFLLSVVELTLPPPPSKYHHQEGKNAACVRCLTGINVDSVGEGASRDASKRREEADSAAGLQLWVGYASVSWLSLYWSTNLGGRQRANGR